MVLFFNQLPNDLHFACSIGNFFFAGARIFFQSLDAAIFLFSRVSEIPAESTVLPAISTNDRLTLGCELWVGMSCQIFCFLHANKSNDHVMLLTRHSLYAVGLIDCFK